MAVPGAFVFQLQKFTTSTRSISFKPILSMNLKGFGGYKEITLKKALDLKLPLRFMLRP
jgi:hypothetical protein